MLMARLLPDVLGQFTGRNERLSNTNIIVWNKYNLETKQKFSELSTVNTMVISCPFQVVWLSINMIVGVTSW